MDTTTITKDLHTIKIDCKPAVNWVNVHYDDGINKYKTKVLGSKNLAEYRSTLIRKIQKDEYHVRDRYSFITLVFEDETFNDIELKLERTSMDVKICKLHNKIRHLSNLLNTKCMYYENVLHSQSENIDYLIENKVKYHTFDVMGCDKLNSVPDYDLSTTKLPDQLISNDVLAKYFKVKKVLKPPGIDVDIPYNMQMEGKYIYYWESPYLSWKEMPQASMIKVRHMNGGAYLQGAFIVNEYTGKDITLFGKIHDWTYGNVHTRKVVKSKKYLCDVIMSKFVTLEIFISDSGNLHIILGSTENYALDLSDKPFLRVFDKLFIIDGMLHSCQGTFDVEKLYA
jgi:hypothetical protein